MSKLPIRFSKIRHSSDSSLQDDRHKSCRILREHQLEYTGISLQRDDQPDIARIAIKFVTTPKRIVREYSKSSSNQSRLRQS